MASATRAKRGTGPLLCPFTIVVDTQEQKPYAFDSLLGDGRNHHRTWAVPLHSEKLRTGDYAIQGLETEAGVERKSPEDFFRTLGEGRHRFARLLARAKMFKFFCVVVEAEWSAMIAKPPPYSQLQARTAWRTVITWRVRYPWVQWAFCHSRAMGEVTTFRLLEKVWKEHNNQKAGEP